MNKLLQEEKSESGERIGRFSASRTAPVDAGQTLNTRSEGDLNGAA
jgi:hypothetical protein